MSAAAIIAQRCQRLAAVETTSIPHAKKHPPFLSCDSCSYQSFFQQPHGARSCVWLLLAQHHSKKTASPLSFLPLYSLARTLLHHASPTAQPRPKKESFFGTGQARSLGLQPRHAHKPPLALPSKNDSRFRPARGSDPLTKTTGLTSMNKGAGLESSGISLIFLARGVSGRAVLKEVLSSNQATLRFGPIRGPFH